MDVEQKMCKRCGEEREILNFSPQSRDPTKRRNICNACNYKRSKDSGYIDSRKEENRQYQKAYHKRSPEVAKHKSYTHQDKVKNFSNSITLIEYRELIKEGCFYCGVFGDIGLDRIDNSLGHNKSNCKPCCEKCNFILGDIPYEAKLLMIPSLTEIKQNNLLNNWIIPTKRTKNE